MSTNFVSFPWWPLKGMVLLNAAHKSRYNRNSCFSAIFFSLVLTNSAFLFNWATFAFDYSRRNSDIIASLVFHANSYFPKLYPARILEKQNIILLEFRQVYFEVECYEFKYKITMSIGLELWWPNLNGLMDFHSVFIYIVAAKYAFSDFFTHCPGSEWKELCGSNGFREMLKIAIKTEKYVRIDHNRN